MHVDILFCSKIPIEKQHTLTKLLSDIVEKGILSIMVSARKY